MYRECVNNHRDGRERERAQRDRGGFQPDVPIHQAVGTGAMYCLTRPPHHLSTLLPDLTLPLHTPLPSLHCGQYDTSCQTRFLGLRFMCFLRFLPSLELLRVIGPVQALATWRRYELDRQIPLRYPTLDEAFLIPPKVLVHGSGTGGSPALFG